MSTESTSPDPPDALDELIANLLDCGGVLSQIISGMVEWEASGRSAPGLAPIPEIAHSVIRSVAAPVSQDHSKRDVKVAAKIVQQLTKKMCDEIFAIDPEWFDALMAESEEVGDEVSSVDASDGDHVERFVRELLRTGCMLSDLAAELIEVLPAEEYPGDEPGAVVIEMLCGTIATAVGSADPADVERATELIDLAAGRTAEHLQLACALSRRLHGEDGSAGRNYG